MIIGIQDIQDIQKTTTVAITSANPLKLMVIMIMVMIMTTNISKTNHHTVRKNNMILLFTTVVHLTPAATLVLPLVLPLTTAQALGVEEIHGQAEVLTVEALQVIGKILN